MNRENLLKNISINNRCPICENENVKTINKINSNVEDFKDIFDLLICKECDHRFISKFPNDTNLAKLLVIVILKSFLFIIPRDSLFYLIV